jgi:hypothetical protein
MCENIGECPICGRSMIKNGFNDEHHLIPKAKNGRYTDKVRIHRVCHEKIHSIWSESELASFYYTIERINSHHDMKKFIKWVKKKPDDFYAKTKLSATRKRK